MINLIKNSKINKNTFVKNGILLAFATAIISGISIFINSFAVKGFDSTIFTFSKNIVVALFLFCVILGVNQLNELKKLNKKEWGQLALIGFIGGSIPFVLFFKGLQMTTGQTAGFIHKSLFIFVTIIAIIFLKEKLTKWLFLGCTLLLVGNYFMIKPDFVFSTGHLFIIGAVLLWAVENVYSKKVLKSNKMNGNIVAFGRMFFGSIFILGYIFATDKQGLISSMNIAQWQWVGLTSGLLFLYVLTYYNSLKYIEVSTAASILAIGAPITTVLALIFNGIAISIMQALGIVFIVFGVMCIAFFPGIGEKLSKNLGASNHERN